MKIITFSLAFLLFIACKDNQNINDYRPPINQESVKSNQSSYTNTSNKVKEDIVWNDVKIKNFTFKLPSNFRLDNNTSNYNKKVYVVEEETLGLSIDIADLPNGYENSDISEMIPNPNDFGNSINQDNNRYFGDFKLLNSKLTHLGNNQSVEITQTSTKVSGKNISMIIKAHFTIANPYYFSITFSYPSNSFDGEQTINKIKNSFKFELPKNKESAVDVNQDTHQPSLKESQSWLISKLNNYLVQKTNYSDATYGPVNKSVITFTNVSVEDNSLVFRYNYKLYEPYIDERTQSNYNNSGISQDMALRLTKDKRLTRDENKILMISFKSISDTYYDKTKNYSGECDFNISSKNNDMIDKNITKGTTNYSSYFSFTYDCSKEEDLGNRINKAIQHIISLTPKENKINNEPF